MRFRILGPLEVLQNGEITPLGGAKQRLLLAILLANANRVVSTEGLADELWGEHQPRNPAKAIQSLVSRLRRHIGHGERSQLLTKPPGYMLTTVAPEHDALYFEQLVTESDRVEDAQGRLELLDEALDLWRGRAYAEFSDHEFARLEAIRLEQLRLDTAEQRFDVLLDLGRHLAAIPPLEAFVEAEPLRERARGQLMEALYRSGRQADALKVFSNYGDLLGRMGLEPSQDLQRLELAVLTDDLHERDHPRGQDDIRARVAKATPGQAAVQLERQGDGAMWAGDPRTAIDSRRRAFSTYVRSGDSVSAARTALALAINQLFRLRLSVAKGWLSRARSLLEGTPEVPEHGHVAAVAALLDLGTGDLEGGLENARIAFEIGRRLSDPDLQALGLTHRGYGLVRQGHQREGMELIDEAMARAVGGELGQFATGMVYCRTLSASLDQFDYQRAAEWTEEIEAQSPVTGTIGFPGDCRTHRVAVLIAKGSWAQGEEEAKQAIAECESFDLNDVGLASYELGEIRLRFGDLEGAEKAFAQALESGTIPEPGRSFLRLARGEVDSAAAALQTALAGNRSDLLTRAPLLAAQVEISIAADDLLTAQAAASELAEITKKTTTTALDATSLHATGAVQLAQGDSGGAVETLSRARRGWSAVGSPYEAARTRLLLAQALRAEGDTAGSALELSAARSAFDDLGARLDAAAAKAQAAAQ